MAKTKTTDRKSTPQCPYCKEKRTSMQDLESHLPKCRNKRFECSICGSSLKEAKYLKKHMKLFHDVTEIEKNEDKVEDSKTEDDDIWDIEPDLEIDLNYEDDIVNEETKDEVQKSQDNENVISKESSDKSEEHESENKEAAVESEKTEISKTAERQGSQKKPAPGLFFGRTIRKATLPGPVITPKKRNSSTELNINETPKKLKLSLMKPNLMTKNLKSIVRQRNPIKGKPNSEIKNSVPKFYKLGSTSATVVRSMDKGVQTESKEETKTIKSTSEKPDESLLCLHCDIRFGDEMMFIIHSGLHTRENSFLCNMCGDTCKDK